MIGFRVGDIGTLEQAKRGFFDSKRVLDAADRATRKVLSKFGAYVRQRDRTSQRRRKSVSAAGEAPSAHLGLVRDLTLFSYDPERREVVIGPAKLNKPGRALVLLEEGGEADIIRHGKTLRAFYKPRPHTRPAFLEELKRMPPDWRGSIT